MGNVRPATSVTQLASRAGIANGLSLSKTAKQQFANREIEKCRSEEQQRREEKSRGSGILYAAAFGVRPLGSLQI